jgi:hypothetical protein
MTAGPSLQKAKSSALIERRYRIETWRARFNFVTFVTLQRF